MFDVALEHATCPSAEQVARRALALSAVVCRAYLEEGAGRPESERMRAAIRAWLARVGGSAELAGDEAALLDAPIGSLSRPQRAQAVWLSERLGVLAWALGRTELPDDDELFDPRVVAGALGFLSEDAADLVVAPSLRDLDEQRAMRDRLSAQVTRLRHAGAQPQTLDVAAWQRSLVCAVERFKALSWLLGQAEDLRAPAQA